MDLAQVRRFRRILRRFQRLNSAQLKSCCSRVTLAQCLVLLEIDDSDRLTMSQLASGLRLDNSTLSRTVDGLVERGLVERERGEEDRRAVWVRLTPSGKAECQTIHEDNDARCREVFNNIPASRQASVIRSFEQLVQAFLDREEQSVHEGHEAEAS